MELTAEIRVRKINKSSVTEVDFNALQFGKYISDHMLLCDFNDGEWQPPQIVPYSNLSIGPSALALHYGQTVFEGMKAFRMKDGRINIFRIAKHYDRFVKSLERLCMEIVPKEIFVEGLMQLVKLDKGWVPEGEGCALYLRPFSFASEEKFGIKISEEYRFLIFSGPVPMLYPEPVKVKVETHYVRAARGGTGAAKCGGNYAASLLPAKKAKEEGYDQLLWTDSKEHKYLEEAGMMNVLFVIDGAIVTPPLSDSILDGVTRDSLLQIADYLGYKIEQRPISIDEIKTGIQCGKITEAFGAGTAAVISPIAVIGVEGKNYNLAPYDSDSVMYKLKSKLDAIRYGVDGDIFEWNSVVG